MSDEVTLDISNFVKNLSKRTQDIYLLIHKILTTIRTMTDNLTTQTLK